MSDDVYWASKPPEELGDELVKRVQSDAKQATSLGINAMRRASFRAYFGLDEQGAFHKSSAVRFAGRAGELATLKVNALRNLVQHMLTYMARDRLAWQVRAESSTYDALAQAKLCNAALDHYRKAMRAENELRRAKEMAIVLDEAYVLSEWDVTKGREYGANPETGQIVREGDLAIECISPSDVIKDHDRAPNKQDWHIVRRRVNKWDLVSRYPEHREHILNSDVLRKEFDETSLVPLLTRKESDDVAVYDFMHRKTDALPAGRLVRFVDADTILFDRPLPYHDVTLRRMAISDLWGTAYGYAPAYDALALQTGLDALYSIVMTNQSAFGVQNIAVEDDSNVGPEQLEGGMNIWKIPRGAQPPKAIALTSTPEEVFRFIEIVEKAMEKGFGLNSVVRGDPAANLKSGSALAFAEARVQQFMSSAQGASAMLDEDVGTDWIKILKAFAQTERMIEISGRDSSYQVKSFKAGDIAAASHVVVDIGNPLMNSITGRLEVGRDLLQMEGAKLEPSEYLQVVTTGSLDPLIKSRLTHLDLIKRENEMLALGPPAQQSPEGTSFVRQVPALPTDDHELHMQEHRCVLDDPDARSNQAVVAAVLAHISEHREYALQQMPQEPAPMPGDAPGKPPGSPDTGEPQQPRMPINPSTGERTQAPGEAAAA